jgi:Protein of unknown function (DUF499)
VAASLFAAVKPRADVLAGTLTDAIFAASLEEVVAETAPGTYSDAGVFFASTFPSGGLKTLLNEALGRLGGAKPDGASVIRLETNLGGGKTHNLIALYHAAKGRLDPVRAMEFMDPGLLPGKPVEQIGVFVGTGAGATTFPAVHGIAPKTAWGYLALQLGGVAGYELVRTDDEGLTAPGAAALKELFGGRPSLILIDEIARYYETAQGKAVGGSNLARQTTAFLMALMEAVDAQPNAVLVITTTSVTEAFGEETQQILDAIAEARSLLARKEHVLQPSDEADLPKILARRLFEPVTSGAASQVATAYADAANTALAQGTDLPEAMTGPGWATEIARTYPFHPMLVRVLDKRLSTIPNFQRTRGALRLLARVVRRLWDLEPAATQLIHLHHVDLGDKDIAEDLSSRLDKATFEPVIRADVASQPGGEPSHAERVDEHMGAPFARRLATTTYLWSLTRDVPGVPAAELLGSVLAPGDDPNVIVKALDSLEASAWYLHADVRGYRFSTEASLVKLVQEAEREITPPKAKARATKILTEQYRDGALKVRRAWEDARVPDNADDAWLVVLHWDDFGDAHGVDRGSPPPPKIAKDLWERTPSGGLREYRNRLVFIAPAADTHEAMLRGVRRHLALEALAANTDTLARLSPEKRTELRDKAKESALEARVAVCNHVNVVYVPRASGLETIELDVVTQASVKLNQTDAILERLAAMDKTLAAGDKPLDPAYIRAKLGALLDRPVPTNELVRAFARRSDLKLVLDRAQLVNLVSAGVRNGVWEYSDPERGAEGWATKDRPAVAVRLADDTWLHPVGSAPAPSPVACPFCGQIHTGPCAGPGPGPGPGPQPAPDSVFRTSGAAGAAVTQAHAAAADAGRQQVRRLTVTIDTLGSGTGAELARLHTVVPPSTLGVTLLYEVEANVVLDEPAHALQVRFTGSPSEYQPLRDALKQVLSTRQATLKASLDATFDPSLDLSGDGMGQVAQRAVDTGPSKCTVVLTTEDGT